MYAQLYRSVADAARSEGFAGGTSSGGAAIVALVSVALLIFVQLFIVRWLWNTVLVRTVSIVRPLPDLWYTLGFLVLMAMIHPSTVAVTAA